MPLTVLVVDDEPGIRLAVSDYLELAGYGVITAENGRQAWDSMQRYRPHLMVTDVRMPQIDGYELVRRLRQQPMFRLLPVIFLTERSQTQDRIQGYRLGGDLYLGKPFELDELGAIIRNLLDRAQIVQSELQANVQPQLPLGREAYRFEDLRLTQREQDVLLLLTEGMSNAQIGDRLHLSSRTIEKYVSKLLQKTDTNNRAEIVRVALEYHLVDPHPRKGQP